ncbi:MAG: glycosyltransferase, partial [Verrucomicrobiaceae bacterium]
LCRTLNQALAVAKGEYVAIIATDDLWLPDKLRIQVEALEKSPPEVGLIYSDAYRIDEAGNLLPGLFIESHRSLEKMPEGDILKVLIKGNFLPAMTPLIRRAVYDKVGHFDERLCYEDWDMWLRIAQQYQFAFCPTITAKYRIVGTSMSRTLLHSQDSNVFASNYLLLSKCLDYPQLSPELERVVRNELSGLCKLQIVAHELSTAIPAGSRYLLAEPHVLPVWADARRKPVPFVEKDGQDWGPPADDATAVDELARMIREGAQYFAIAWPSFWWLEHYKGFFEHLRSNFRCIRESEYVVVFEL